MEHPVRWAIEVVTRKAVHSRAGGWEICHDVRIEQVVPCEFAGGFSLSYGDVLSIPGVLGFYFVTRNDCWILSFFFLYLLR